MTWEETIQYIRTQPEYSQLVKDAYFSEDLVMNVESFRHSDEFKETLNILKNYSPNAISILDIGSGNGISSVAFALNGFDVTVSEPDPSKTIGAGAIKILKDHYKLNNLHIYEEFAERIQFSNKLFDVVYVRQAMHHAYDLNLFIANISKFLKPGGLLLTIRDHVIINEEDKNWFLETHALHKYYGGENAFTVKEYKEAFFNSGLEILKTIKYYDSVINYFPVKKDYLIAEYKKGEHGLKQHLRKRIGLLAYLPFVFKLYKMKVGFNESTFFDETKTPGRMYSFITKKK